MADPQDFTVELVENVNGSYGSFALTWPPQSIHRMPTAKMPMALVYPRPDGETLSHARHKWAHPDFVYEIPIGIQGGNWPFKYEIVSGPAGATIGMYYDRKKIGRDNEYGVVRWQPTASSGAFSFTVRVTDCSDTPNTIDVTWSGTIDAAAFVFVQAGYAGTKVGTVDQPLATFSDWYKNSDSDATYANKIIVWREGAGSYIVTGNEAANPTNVRFFNDIKSPYHIYYPGENPVFDCTNAKFLDDPGGTLDIFVYGIIFENARNDLANPHYFFLTAANCSRATFCKNRFTDMSHGTSGNDNTGPIFSADTNPQPIKNYFFTAHNEFDGINNSTGNNGHLLDVYTTSNVLVELNVAANCHTNSGFWMKGTVANVTVRGNIGIENMAGSLCILGYGLEAHQVPHDHEVVWNEFNSPGYQVINIGNSNSYAGQTYNTFINRNTLSGASARLGFVGAENFETDVNIVAVTDLSLWDLSKQTTAIANLTGAVSIINSDNVPVDPTKRFIVGAEVY